ncbi:MAG: RluA family pseudouridine synthase [Treponema sp.]|nr:RluA family pseudouridine synthase [Spirochaetia bacterium]MDD7533073.1 RluA family pseudouridine synthase [Treponema sp.]MDY5759131.1 RluA family pseudouridine synthase [Treponema sp.]MDY5817739.1 RluA family pseudouridine synthase [Treponema sp.]
MFLKQVGRESLERKDQGVMIGSLVCWDKKEKKRIILYAVSGNNKQLIPVNTNSKDLFVPSIVSSEQIDQALKENDKEIHELTEQINELTFINKASPQRARLLKQRTALTDSSLQKVFHLYLFTKYDGRKLSLNGIIKCHNNHLPPTGTGDCCAPKLLSYAFEKDYEIISMDEVYYGRDTKNKKNGISYAPCDERCGYILPSIMGLEILYRDKYIIVINKPSGLLSVPGKGKDKEDCAEARVRNLFPDAPKQCAVHRLDMETSGILVLALNKEAHRKLNEQFAEGKVHKRYIALLDGILHGKPEGRTELPFRLDIENRPHQIYDPVNGKIGITEWKKLGVEKGLTRIEFSPLTGRTHQLRLAASCPAEHGGLGIPIKGDSLYGSFKEGERLMLHAAEIEFFHPVSGEKIHLICQPDF